MSTTMKQKETCPNLVPPAGINLPIGTKGKVDFLDLKSSIAFKYDRLGQPCQPLTVAIWNKDKTLINVSTVVFIDKELSIKENDIVVKQYLSYDNNQVPFLQFFICYDQKPKHGNAFSSYRLDFEAVFGKAGYTKNEKLEKEGIHLPPPTQDQIKFIITTLWDEDPETSRGTVTTVKSGTGG